MYRPFDAEKAKAGHPVVIDLNGWEQVKYLAGPDKRGTCAIEYNDEICTCYDTNLRMASVGTVEGEPVFPGDILEGIVTGYRYEVYMTADHKRAALRNVESGVPIPANGFRDLRWPVKTMNLRILYAPPPKPGMMCYLAAQSDHATWGDMLDGKRLKPISINEDGTITFEVPR